MQKTVSRASGILFIIVVWFVLCTIGSFFVLAFSSSTNSKNLSLFVSGISKNLVSEAEKTENTRVLSSFEAHDGRVLIVNKFLAKYRSPMAGHGNIFIEAADTNGLDWRLLPAIAFQESNLGKKIPKGSHNPFGWGVYTGKNSGASFSNWSSAIKTVASGLRKDYIQKGLHTPETIVIRYASEHATWVFGVRSAMAELSELEN